MNGDRGLALLLGVQPGALPRRLPAQEEAGAPPAGQAAWRKAAPAPTSPIMGLVEDVGVETG
jgi:hypothetical protein